MLDSPIVQVLIGIFFIYSLFSILVTQTNSVLSNVLKLRARHLRGAIDEILADDKVRAKLLVHPLIRFTKETAVVPDEIITDEQAKKILNGTIENVSWIAPDTFAKVVLNIVGGEGGTQLFGALLEIVRDMPPGEARSRLQSQINTIMTTGKGLEELRVMINGVKDDEFRTQLQQAVNNIYQELTQMGIDPQSLVPILSGLQRIENQAFRSAMRSILATVNTLEEAQSNIAMWFDDSMARTTDAFKRTMQAYSLVAGLLIAILLNVDSLYITQALWTDSSLREATATAALVAVQSGQTGEVIAPDTDDPLADATTALNQAGNTLEEIITLNLPMGWVWQAPPAEEEVDAMQQPPPQRNLYYIVPRPDLGFGDWAALWFVKILGISATAIAIAQGAPFWFGILLRLSGGTSST